MGVCMAAPIIQALLCPAARRAGNADSASKWTQEHIGFDGLDNIDPSGHSFFFLDEQDHRANPNVQEAFSKRLRLPDWFWSPNYQRLNGGFGCEDEFDEAGNVQSRRSWVRFLVKILGSKRDSRNYPTYKWYEMTFFTLYENNQTTTLCINTPEPFASRLLSALGRGMTSTLDEFWSFKFILHEITELYDKSVWSIRNVVRDVERERDKDEHGATSDTDASPRHIHRGHHIEPDFLMLHELARHAIHSSETLQVAIDNIIQIIREHDLYYEISSMSRDDPLRQAVYQLRQRLDFRLQYLQSIKARSDAVSARVHNEINLAFNMVSQRDAQAAVRDSAAMRTIATVTLVFLPATFVSAVFSTSFFDFSPSNRSGGSSDGSTGSASGPPPNDRASPWVISDKFWIYWAFAIPLTAVTVLAWYVWHGWSVFPGFLTCGVRSRGTSPRASASTSTGSGGIDGLARKRSKISFMG